MGKNPSPEAELADFGEARSRTLSLLAGLSEDEMARRPRPDRWSAGELADHLLRTEIFWLREIEELVALARAGRRPYLNRVLTDVPLPGADLLAPRLLPLVSAPVSFATALLPTAVFQTFLRFRIIPASAPPILAPRPGRPAATLRAELVSQRKRTEALFRDNADLEFRRLVYQNPLVGLSDATGVLKVITAHERRHQEQLVEILTQIGVR